MTNKNSGLITCVTDRLGNDSVEKLALVSDLEEIITFYSKSAKIAFTAGNGWTDLLQLLSVLKLPKPQLYNCFNALVNRYIPKYVCVRIDRVSRSCEIAGITVR